MRGLERWLVALSVALACACTEPAEQLPVWSCPVEPGPDRSWPAWIGTVYATRGSLEPGSIVTAYRGDETLGAATVRSDGSVLLPLRSDAEETLAGARVSLVVRDRTGGTVRRWARVAEPAPTVFYVYDQWCASDTWTIDGLIAIESVRETVGPLDFGLGVSMLGPGESPQAVQLGVRAPLAIETPCREPWFFFARHLDGRVSGCWDRCPPGATRCGECTRLAWAAGRCQIGPSPEPVEPDAGTPDAGRHDAAPPTPPD